MKLIGIVWIDDTDQLVVENVSVFNNEGGIFYLSGAFSSVDIDKSSFFNNQELDVIAGLGLLSLLQFLNLLLLLVLLFNPFVFMNIQEKLFSI